MNTTIYVMSHASNQNKLKNIPSIYKTLQVGTSLNKDIFGDFQDNVGDNISDKNRNYCELTGLYWVWKNSTEDIVGICHYRRYLMKSADHCLPQYFLNKEQIESILERYDVILPNVFTEKITLKEFYINGKNNKANELLKLREVIQEQCPDYLETYDNFFSGHEDSRCNVMIMKRKEFDGYCSWLFNILFELEKRVDLSDYDTIDSRIYGYLSERLLNIYVRKNKFNVFFCHMETIKFNTKYRIKCWMDRHGILKIIRKLPKFSTKY